MIPELLDAATKLYAELNKNKIECLLDDRIGRMGGRLKDIDLIGIPYKIIIGKTLKEGKVEVKARRTGEMNLVDLNEVVNWLAKN
jgi:prolyl-tRNA synthetase